MIIMVKCAKITGIFLGLWLISTPVFGQETQTSTIPSVLLRPERGEAPRYPRDLVIGELGQGEASDEAYQFAKSVMTALLSGARNSPAFTGSAVLITDNLIESIKSIRPRYYRLGGGRTEADGSVSFLLRFMGREESITGELYVRQEVLVTHKTQEVTEEDAQNGEETMKEEVIEVRTRKWILDGLSLEDKRALSEIRDSYRYDFSPYERFY